jgi:alginate O-acetyltransferase complex protein AlgI
MLGRGVSGGFAKGVGSYLRHNIFILLAAVIYVTPLRRLITVTAEKISKKSEKNYAAVQRIRTAFLAVVMIMSYLLLAAGKL